VFEPAIEDPTEWQFVRCGPSLMVTSPSGMDLRGVRYHLAVWPGPGDEQAAYVACTITKGYASGGREGQVHVIYYGPDLRAAIRASNDDLRSWRGSEHFPPDLQPRDGEPLDEAAVIKSLQEGREGPTGDWQELDSLARRAYRDAEVAWLASADPVTLRYP
jgi:hypothetical protein